MVSSTECIDRILREGIMVELRPYGDRVGITMRKKGRWAAANCACGDVAAGLVKVHKRMKEALD